MLTKNLDMGENTTASRKRLARIRCLHKTITCLENSKPLPTVFSYFPSRVVYKAGTKCKVIVFSEPRLESKKLSDYASSTNLLIVCRGNALCNKQGQWGKVIEVLHWCKVPIIFLVQVSLSF